MERAAAAIVGLLAAALATWLELDPPTRTATVALSACKDAQQCVAQVSSDPTTIVVALISLAGLAGLIAVLGIRFTKIGAGGATLEASVTQATPAEAKKETGRDFAASADAEIRTEAIAAENAAWDQLPDWAKQALQAWANSGQTVVTRPIKAAVVEAEKAEGQGNNPWFVSMKLDDGTTQVFRVATGRGGTSLQQQ
jgi:hypothetical protein